KVMGVKAIRGRKLDQFFRRAVNASSEQVQASQDRVLSKLRSEAEEIPDSFIIACEDDPKVRRTMHMLRGRRTWKRLAPFAAFAAAIAIGVFVPARTLQHAPALLEDRKIEFGEIIRSGSVAGRALVLADSSRVEMRANSELFLEPARDGVRIRLGKGSVL